MGEVTEAAGAAVVEPELEPLATEDVKLLYDLARIGLSRMPAGAHLPLPMRQAYRRVQAWLQDAGEVPR